MTSPPDHLQQSSPWLSVWLRPGDTTERILASNPKHHVLLLAVLAGMAAEVLWWLDTWWTLTLLDW